MENNTPENPYDPKVIYQGIFGSKMAGRAQKWPAVSLSELKEINPDTAGWIYMPKTPVNYPIVNEPSPGYYRTHNFSREKERHGAVVLDWRNEGTIGEYVTKLSAHNMKDWSMFHAVVELWDPAYRKDHPYFEVMIEERYYRARVFAGVFRHNKDPEIDRINFLNREDYGRWLELICRRNEADDGIIPSVNDRILSCHTCTFNDNPDDDIYAVYGIMEEMHR